MDDDLTAPGAIDALEAIEVMDAAEVSGNVTVTTAPGDVADDDLEVDPTTLDAIEQELEDIERALTLLDEGTYGRCDVCRKAVDDVVLVDAPATRFCAAHLPIALD